MRFTRIIGLALAAALSLVASPSVASTPSAVEEIPAGFSEHTTQVGAVGIHYVIGGHGPTLVLIHGYPQTWYEWHHIMPALAEHYTVIAPDLRGAGGSDAPATGYDKKTLAADLHGLLTQLGRTSNVRIVGHDIGTMVAYAYAAAHRADVTKLVLSEAPIPDPGIYDFPSLTKDGPGAWHFGFFALTNGMPEQLIQGREQLWTDKFIDNLEVKKGSVTPAEVAVFARHLSEPGHLAANLAWFRTFPQDMTDNARNQKIKLTMPVLAIGASGSLGPLVGEKAKEYARHVTPVTVADSGHWIYEEHPAEMTSLLLTFLKGNKK
ncbi:alpha/beta fold hydrolase [Actinoplanes awajinensis]|uniref:Alpha/beta hydrolase n=1 Tax=Actinoplanes awajinensis subsp. mycoplanecinus TaxID=135947 RepID=A0A0X3VA51_9ACTN|nr:alpha/beta hydrolase [Actinoplanes awajinensis]KUL41568.1 alpha/beta hydrolase [Actinoplanes awajinensis subsp. mycoplanecinus]